MGCKGDKGLFVTAKVEPGKLNALVKNLMSQMDTTDPNEAVRRVNSGEWVVQPDPRWREMDGVIYFSVTTNGTSGSDWGSRLEKKGLRIWEWAKDVLNSPDFKPMKAGITLEIAVIRGTRFIDSDRTTKNVRAEGNRRGWKHGNDISPEIACLIREKFTDEELEAMGLWWIVVMHEPINDSDGDPNLGWTLTSIVLATSGTMMVGLRSSSRKLLALNTRFFESRPLTLVLSPIPRPEWG